jgi:hypothetical protein
MTPFAIFIIGIIEMPPSLVSEPKAQLSNHHRGGTRAQVQQEETGGESRPNPRP